MVLIAKWWSLLYGSVSVFGEYENFGSGMCAGADEEITSIHTWDDEEKDHCESECDLHEKCLGYTWVNAKLVANIENCAQFCGIYVTEKLGDKTALGVDWEFFKGEQKEILTVKPYASDCTGSEVVVPDLTCNKKVQKGKEKGKEKGKDKEKEEEKDKEKEEEKSEKKGKQKLKDVKDDSGDNTVIIVVVVVAVVLLALAGFVLKVFVLGKRKAPQQDSTNQSEQVTANPTALNPPGEWSVFLSHTQRNAEAKAICEALYGDLSANGFRVWLDIKMDQRSVDAMEEGVKNSACVFAIITGAEIDPEAPNNDVAQNAYFSRPLCLQELRWARDAKVPIQPIVKASDKKKIMEFVQSAPDDLKDLAKTDFIHLDRSDPDYWKVGITKLTKVLNANPRGCGHATEQQPGLRTASTPSYKGPASAQIGGSASAQMGKVKPNIDTE